MTTETQATHSDPGADARPLLAEIKKGDPASCRPLIHHFEGPLYNYLYWLTGDPESAADLFHRTIAETVNNLGRVRKSSSVKDWVFKTATLLCLEQTRRQQQKRRSSWDNILRGGVAPARDDKWSTWDDEESAEEAEMHDQNAALVDTLKALSLKERAAVLLACAVEMRPLVLGESLNLSRRRAERLLLEAYDRVCPRAKDAEAGATPALKSLRDNIRRRQFHMLSPGRERKLADAIGAVEGGAALAAAEDAALKTVQGLPDVHPPEDLATQTVDHLRVGHEAQEERIATWGFRFMQVTVPVFIIAIIAIILLPTISRSLEAARQAAGAENLETIGKALLEYSAQSEGNRLPPMVTDVPGAWVPDLRLLYPRYIKDPALLVRPSLNDPELVKAIKSALEASPPDFATAHALMARSYVYTGYVLLDEAALAAFKSALESPTPPDIQSDIDTADKMLRRLKRDVEYFFVANRSDPLAAASTRAAIPIMFERVTASVFGRDPDSANVLYLDGHVDPVRFGSAFPVTPGVQELLGGG